MLCIFIVTHWSAEEKMRRFDIIDWPIWMDDVFIRIEENAHCFLFNFYFQWKCDSKGSGSSKIWYTYIESAACSSHWRWVISHRKHRVNICSNVRNDCAFYFLNALINWAIRRTRVFYKQFISNLSIFRHIFIWFALNIIVRLISFILTFISKSTKTHLFAPIFS